MPQTLEKLAAARAASLARLNQGFGLIGVLVAVPVHVPVDREALGRHRRLPALEAEVLAPFLERAALAPDPLDDPADDVEGPTGSDRGDRPIEGLAGAFDEEAGFVFDLSGSYRMAFLNGLLWNLLNLSIAAFLMMRRKPTPAIA